MNFISKFVIFNEYMTYDSFISNSCFPNFSCYFIFCLLHRIYFIFILDSYRWFTCYMQILLALFTFKPPPPTTHTHICSTVPDFTRFSFFNFTRFILRSMQQIQTLEHMYNNILYYNIYNGRFFFLSTIMEDLTNSSLKVLFTFGLRKIAYNSTLDDIERFKMS